MDEVVDFIKRRWSQSSANWLDGNCYWFARILQDRFPYLDIWYCPVSGHFVTYDPVRKKFYDQRGLIEPKEWAIPLFTIFQEEPNWYYRLMKDCMM